MRDLPSGVECRQHRRSGRAWLALGAVVDAVAGPQRHDLHERPGLPGTHRSHEEQQPRRARPPDASRGGAAGPLGLPAWTEDGRHRPDAAAVDARPVRRRHAQVGRSRNALPPGSLTAEDAMETYKLTVNGQPKEATVDPGTPLLWVL